MIHRLLIFSLIVGLVSCDHGHSSKTIKTDKENIVKIEKDDIEMNIAIENARASFQQFDKAYASNKFDTSTFSIKVKFPTPSGGYEHMWTANVKKENGDYYGTIDEEPESTQMIKMGDRIKINKDDITDWIYSDSGILRGGFTVKVIRNRLTNDEKLKFDSNFSLKIND